uniref:Uncharacterized protein n=1 Tax=Oryza meridionalis TaxID=40149 RepID=A0A0E0D0K6_9ORYZ
MPEFNARRLGAEPSWLHVRVRVCADTLRCLAVPLSRNGPERQITGVLLDGAHDLLRHCQPGWRRNGRCVLLGFVEEQDWMEYVSSLPPRTTAAHDMSTTGAKYIDHNMVFFPVNQLPHFFMAALNVATSKYQMLDRLLQLRSCGLVQNTRRRHAVHGGGRPG